jgi:hypothetical protein
MIEVHSKLVFSRSRILYFCESDDAIQIYLAGYPGRSTHNLLVFLSLFVSRGKIALEKFVDPYLKEKVSIANFPSLAERPEKGRRQDFLVHVGGGRTPCYSGCLQQNIASLRIIGVVFSAIESQNVVQLLPTAEMNREIFFLTGEIATLRRDNQALRAESVRFAPPRIASSARKATPHPSIGGCSIQALPNRAESASSKRGLKV